MKPRLVAIEGIARDITDRRKLEEQFQQAQRLEGVGRLAGGVAHDFNNLLTVINGYTQMALIELPSDHRLREYLDEVLKAGERAAALTQQLLAFGRKQPVNPAVLNINAAVLQMEKMLQRLIGEDINLRTNLAPDLGNVLADFGQLQQVIMNLAVNSRDAMPDGGPVLIKTSNVNVDEAYVMDHPGVRQGPHVLLAVTDSGTGMTPEVQARLFEPFFTTKPQGAGTGLGLAIVYGIVKQNGGSIWVHSERGRGTTFAVYLPRIDAVVVKLPLELDPTPASLRGTETILVVEDQDQLRKMAVRVLRSYGYRVLEAANPGEALLLHSEHHAGRIDLLLTDVVMPGMTGFELAGRIKPLRPAMEIVFISGYSERATTDRLELTASYLPKPFSPETLARKVRGVLGSVRPASIIL
jgi:nitrogen-specific signal transduction histidine kinase/CheY-like chemotaxis protein